MVAQRLVIFHCIYSGKKLNTPIHLFFLFAAAFVSLRSIIIVELLGIEKLTNSFGYLVLCQGLSTFIGSPIAGN